MVPSAAMGRDIPVKFQGGGSHAVYLLDGLRARDDNSGWDIETAAFKDYSGPVCRWSCPSAACPASTPTGRARPSATAPRYTYQWETFLTSELPAYLSANKGDLTQRQCGRRAVHVGQRRADPGRLSPGPVPLRGIAVGLSEPVRRHLADAGRVRDARRRRLRRHRDVGSRRRSLRGSATTRRSTPLGWRATARASGCTAATARPASSAERDFPAALLESITLDSNKDFQKQYLAAGGGNGTFNFPANGTHSWGYWGSQLAAMKGDIQRTLGA